MKKIVLSQENKYLLEKEVLRQKRREFISEANKEKLASLDTQFQEKEQELRKHYQQLEENLQIRL